MPPVYSGSHPLFEPPITFAPEIRQPWSAMCSVVIMLRPGHDWPVLLAANRDEMKDRPWLPPGRHWPERPWVVACLDCKAGGSWLGLNDHGLVAGVMNRAG